LQESLNNIDNIFNLNCYDVDITSKQARRVQRQAKNSLSITLPSDWCKKNNVEAKTILLITEINDSALKIEKMKE